MKHLKLENKELPIYHSSEEFLMRLRVDVTQKMEQVRFRLTLRNDGDVGIGTAWSEPLSFPETGETEVLLSMPLASVEKGNFYVSIGLYRFGELGQSITLDHITRVCKIEVEGPPVWSTEAHGYIRFPEIRRL
jgi:hypothetical protein